MSARDVVITGIGLVSSLGEGVEQHWNVLSTPGAQPVLDPDTFLPYTVHPLPEIDWSQQIAKRGDQRQMETWQRLGTYAAGLALDDANAKDETLLANMDMIVAAGGGERDVNVDQAILDAARTRNDRDVLLNEKLTTELRPTLFLAQLSNLLAGNISIVHKVTGSSRTFMGEEGAGVSAIETAAARIASGQSNQALVGGAFQTEHPDMLLGYELGGFLHRKRWKSVWKRAANDGGGLISGSGAAFLMLESREHAEARGARAYAAIAGVASGRARRNEGNLSEAISGLLRVLSLPKGNLLAISGASGAHAATGAERSALAAAGDFAIRGFSSLTGHMKEAQFPFAVALAAMAIKQGAAYPAFDPENEGALTGDAPTAAVATTIGYSRYEGAALVVSA
jgi:3-oxoacyl-[acyl-carrier-protein] synthase II